jgi:hypothetical protein
MVVFEYRSLIHLLFLGTVIYQFTPTGKRIIVDGISWRFAALMTFNIIHMNVWVNRHYKSAFIFSLLIGFTVSVSTPAPSFLVNLSSYQ